MAKLEYMKVVQNVALTREEAQTLYNALKILKDIKQDITYSGCSYDQELLNDIESGINGLEICNPRLNVNITAGKDFT